MPFQSAPDFSKAIRESGITFQKLTTGAPALNRTKLSWAFQDTDNRELIRFRERFELDRVIEGAQDDWEAVRRLRNWVYQQNTRGGNDLSTLASGGNAEALLLAVNAGGEYWCTFFAQIAQTVMQAMGYPARHLGVSCEYDRFQRSTHHGVAEVWVNSLKKWVLLDPHFDIHFTLDGQMLDAYQYHRATLAGRGPDVVTHKGLDAIVFNPTDRVDAQGKLTVKEYDCFFWRYYDLHNTPFSEAGTWTPHQTALLTDHSHQGLTWWQGNRTKHVGYGGRFVETQDVSDVYFDLNTVYLEPLVKKYPYQTGLIVSQVGTFTPNLDKLETRIDNGAWQPQTISTRVQWWLHPGDNIFEVRAINKLGRRGPITRMQVDGVKHPAPQQVPEAAAASH